MSSWKIERASMNISANESHTANDMKQKLFELLVEEEGEADDSEDRRLEKITSTMVLPKRPIMLISQGITSFRLLAWFK
jgi:hypothetical protein